MQFPQEPHANALAAASEVILARLATGFGTAATLAAALLAAMPRLLAAPGETAAIRALAASVLAHMAASFSALVGEGGVPVLQAGVASCRLPLAEARFGVRCPGGDAAAPAPFILAVVRVRLAVDGLAAAPSSMLQAPSLPLLSPLSLALPLLPLLPLMVSVPPAILLVLVLVLPLRLLWLLSSLCGCAGASPGPASLSLLPSLLGPDCCLAAAAAADPGTAALYAAVADCRLGPAQTTQIDTTSDLLQ